MNGGGGSVLRSSSESRADGGRRSGGPDKEGVIPLWCINSAEGAVWVFALRLRQKMNAPIMRAMRMTAPMTPPAMGPALLFEEAFTTGEGERLGTGNDEAGEEEEFSWEYVKDALYDWQVWVHIMIYMSIIGPREFLPTSLFFGIA